ncbi:MAG: two pore domain potassium channel family protein [Proteobacteria bacterium]|nr:two pore domain potassium channel family protein [Pseudomonadota bacterium]
MLVEIITCLVMIVLTILIHYEGLRLTSISLVHWSVPPRPHILLVVFASFIIHALAILLYAASYYLLAEVLEIGAVAGVNGHDFYGYFYYSISSYTSLGIGDVFPSGNLRILTGVEALNGLVLITWSASFTYLAMQKFWDLHDPGK